MRCGLPIKGDRSPYKDSGGSEPRHYRDVGLLIGGKWAVALYGQSGNRKDPQRPLLATWKASCPGATR